MAVAMSPAAEPNKAKDRQSNRNKAKKMRWDKSSAAFYSQKIDNICLNEYSSIALKFI